jgi:ribonuclease P protein component
MACDSPCLNSLTTTMSDQRFLRAHRITRGADFQRAYQRRVTAGDDRLLVFAFPNGLTHPRLGVSVSRKVGGAVVRNRWKRCIREAFRLTREQLPCGVDLIVIPRPDAVPGTKELQESLVKLARRAAKRI